MSDIVSSPAPGNMPRPSQNGHATGLIVEDLVPYEVLAEQLLELEADYAAELTAGFAPAEPETTPGPLSDDPAGAADTGPAVLGGFETLTTRDLLGCPAWCAYGQGHTHGDGFDPYEDTAPHRGVELRFNPHHGGTTIDTSGPAEISVQLEQDRNPTTEPRLTLTITINGIEQYATLTPAETRTLHSTIGSLLDDADG